MEIIPILLLQFQQRHKANIHTSIFTVDAKFLLVSISWFRYKYQTCCYIISLEVKREHFKIRPADDLDSKDVIIHSIKCEYSLSQSKMSRGIDLQSSGHSIFPFHISLPIPHHFREKNFAKLICFNIFKTIHNNLHFQIALHGLNMYKNT